MNRDKIITQSLALMAEPTGFEPANSDVTGRRSNQLNYHPAKVVWCVVGGAGFEPAAPGV